MGGMTASLSLYVILAPFRHLGLNPISSGPGKSSNRTSDFGRNPLYPLRRLPGLEKLSALPPRRGLPDENPAERSSEHNQTEGTKHSHLIGDASGIQGFVFSSQPISLSKRQGVWNPVVWRQILVHAKYYEVIKEKSGEIERATNRQDKPR
jgi:hypothetical protein